MCIIVCLLIGLFIGWNVAQPAIVKKGQDVVVNAVKWTYNKAKDLIAKVAK